MLNDFQVTKASGQLEPFQEEKLRRSLHRSGADEATINQIIQDLADQWYEGIRTKAINNKAYKMLKRRNRLSAARYTLKQAMFDFGPSGFPFEDFFAELLKSQGFSVQTRQIVQGKCIGHEVDVVAENREKLIWVECKYHPRAGSISNVKIPLYIHSRFRDMLDNQTNPSNPKTNEGWLVTNTRFSADAMTYAECASMRLIGWNYPANGSLREMVETAKVHPVTCLTLLTKQEKTQLLENGIVLSKSLKNPGIWSEILHLSNERRNKIMAEARLLCSEHP